MNYCTIIPTYNNQKTLADVVCRVLEVTEGDVVVVNDGSTDHTLDILRTLESDQRVKVVSYQVNRGKGHALCEGFTEACRLGYTYAVTIDSDGQHYVDDIPRLTAAGDRLIAAGCSRFIVVGSRNLSADGMPTGNRFANRFGNFWFHVQTFRMLSDTQTGFRLYTLPALPCRRLVTNRYEAELEMLVLSAWRRIHLCEVPVRVYYPPKGERVSHFRPFADFMRIFVLNTILCLFAVVYGYPSMAVRYIGSLLNRAR